MLYDHRSMRLFLILQGSISVPYMSTQSWPEKIAHSAMYTYKGGEQNFSAGTSVNFDISNNPVSPLEIDTLI
jgi:hypothetical protein